MLTWAPKMHALYSNMLRKLLSYNKKLRQPFPNSVFANFTANFGPETVCFDHKDTGNLPGGWCVITALEEFDPKLGGHLVLWDLNLVIEFPPGCSIMIPSAMLRHSNTCIQPGKLRYSFTQYSAGTATGFLFFHGKTVEEQRKKFLCFQILEKRRKRALFFQGPLTFPLFFHHFSMEK